MRIRNLEKRRQQLKEKFLSEIPVNERNRYEETVSIFVDATIDSYLFDGFSGQELIDHLLIKLPQLNGYEHCAYPHDSLSEVLEKYSVRVERKFSKYLKIPKGFQKTV